MIPVGRGISERLRYALASLCNQKPDGDDEMCPDLVGCGHCRLPMWPITLRPEICAHRNFFDVCIRANHGRSLGVEYVSGAHFTKSAMTRLLLS
jgi:hypothetical protein